MKLLRTLVLPLLAGLAFSCETSDAVTQDDGISSDVLAQVAAAGFSTEKVIRDGDGYIIEGDIYLSHQELFKVPAAFRLPNLEQYSTNNLVTGLPRTITVAVSSQLPASYGAALDEMISRYNAENLQLTFQRVTSGANITFVRGNGSYLASAGFPTAGGDPYSQVKINSKAIGSNPNTAYLATIMAHEAGHCIGFRHTDYMDRSYSCGGATANEGASTVGANHIPGTPTTADPGSFMLACIGSNQNRPFNANDKTALGYLY